MKTTCLHCHEATEITFQIGWKEFACPRCHTHFGKDEAGNVQQIKFFPKPPEPFCFHIGQQGVLDGARWEVGGMYLKYPENEPWGWREYVLYNQSGETRFLSESDGHWVLAEEIPPAQHKYSFGSTHIQSHRNESYPIFHNTHYRTACAAGFFEHPVAERGHAKDFVRAPYALLLEKEGKKVFAFDARHLSKKELQAAFPDAELPPQTGQGMLQPFPVDVPVFCTILGGFGIVLVVLQMLLWALFPSYQVAEDYVMLPDTVAEVTHVTRSFETSAIRAPLGIHFSAPVNNSWAAVDIQLVNELTKEERYASVEVAYYWGNDEGEDWTEGSRDPTINICSVPPGRYHLAFTIAKESGRQDLNTLRYQVDARAPMYRNLLVSLGILAVAALVAFLWKAHFEKQRWMNSDYPPDD